MAKKNQQTDVCGVLSLTFAILSWVALGIIFAPLSIIFGIIGLNQKTENKAFSIIGLALGIVSLVILLIFFATISRY